MTGTAFGKFVEHTGSEIRASAGTSLAPRRVRDTLRSALASGSFAVDCVDLVLGTMESRPEHHWRSPPIYDDEEHQYAVRLSYWAAGFENGAHRHDDWTVTGVLHNALRFRTYKEDHGSLVESKRFDCQTGDVGYIDTPCIHNVVNTSPHESISIHIFSGPKIMAPNAEGVLESRGRGRSMWYYAPDAQAGALPDQATGGEYKRARVLALTAFVSLLSKTDDPRRASLLERIFAVGTLPVKLAVVKAMAAHDAARAARKAHELAALCSPEVGRELARIGDSLARAAEVS